MCEAACVVDLAALTTRPSCLDGPSCVASVGMIVRTALGFHDTDRPAPQPAATWRDRRQREAIADLVALRGAERATAALWLLSAFVRRTDWTMGAYELGVFHDAYFTQRGDLRPRYQVAPLTIAEHFSESVQVDDRPSAELAWVLVGVRRWPSNMVLTEQRDGLTVATFDVLHMYAGNHTLWRLVSNAAHPETARHAHATTMEDLRTAAAVARGHATMTLDVAATLAADRPGFHSVEEALGIAALLAHR